MRPQGDVIIINIIYKILYNCSIVEFVIFVDLGTVVMCVCIAGVCFCW